MADYLAGLFGALAALRDRDTRRAGGQWVDVSLYESIFRLLEAVVPEYGKLGPVRERTGYRTGATAPVGTYATRDGRWMALSVSNERIWGRFAMAIGRPKLVEDTRFRTNSERTANADALDEHVVAWFAEHDGADAQAVRDEVGVPVCPIYSMADIFAGPQFAVREDIAGPEDPAVGPVPMPNVVPKFPETPGAVRHTGPALGEHNQEVYRDLLGLDEATLAELRAEGII